MSYNCFTIHVPLVDVVIDVHITWDCTYDEYKQVYEHLSDFGIVDEKPMRYSFCCLCVNDEYEKIVIVIDDNSWTVIAHECFHAVLDIDRIRDDYVIIDNEKQELSARIHSYIMDAIVEEIYL